MKKIPLAILSIAIIACSNSCTVIQDTPKYKFSSGYYSTKANADQFKKAYVEIEEDSIYLYKTSKIKNKRFVDNSVAKKELSEILSIENRNDFYSFRKTSGDIDFLTIPLKYRFSVNRFPNQLNTNLNGGLYLGLRTDVYHVKLDRSPTGKTSRSLTHFGFSFGVFSGVGAAAVNPSVTNNMVDVEYDGVLYINGLTAIVAVNNISLGLTAGIDHLLDNNRKSWIYQKKPWLGLAFGLNLN